MNIFDFVAAFRGSASAPVLLDLLHRRYYHVDDACNEGQIGKKCISEYDPELLYLPI